MATQRNQALRLTLPFNPWLPCLVISQRQSIRPPDCRGLRCSEPWYFYIQNSAVFNLAHDFWHFRQSATGDEDLERECTLGAFQQVEEVGVFCAFVYSVDHPVLGRNYWHLDYGLGDVPRELWFLRGLKCGGVGNATYLEDDSPEDFQPHCARIIDINHRLVIAELSNSFTYCRVCDSHLKRY